MIKDGGPAFPTNAINSRENYVRYPVVGMTLRDYFAANALAMFNYINDGTHSTELMVKKAYSIADAMIIERE